MRAIGRAVAWSGLALTIAGGTVALAQGREPADSGSLAALTVEVRERRLAVQPLAQTQSLQTEESRWSALISRLEALTQR